MKLDINKILAENIQRLKKLNEPYDPLMGTGSPIERDLIVIPELNYKAYLPKEMHKLPFFRRLLEAKSIKEIIDSFPAIHNELDIIVAITRERFKCDFEFWAATCIKIWDKDSLQEVPFRLRRAQRKLLLELEKLRLAGLPIYIILLKARQWGGSTLVQMYMMWIQQIHKRNWHAAICAQDDSAASNISEMYIRAAQSYPKEVSKITLLPYARSPKNRYCRERGGIIGVGSINNPGQFRSYNYPMIHQSELGIWNATLKRDPEELAASLMSTVPSVPYSMIVQESTAKGVGNYFHKMWQNAVSGENNFTPVFVAWWEIENYQAEITDYPSFINGMNEYDWFLWKLGATLEGIKWYNTFKKGKGYSDLKMMEEYPSTCIAGNIRVGTNKGLIKISELKENLYCDSGKITNHINNGIRPVYRIKTELGYILDCTEDHVIAIPSILGTNEWKMLRDFNKKQFIKLQPPIFASKEYIVEWTEHNFVKHTIIITPELCRFIGIFMGDGSYSGQVLSIAFDKQDQDYIDETKNLVKNLFGLTLHGRILGSKNGGYELRAQKKGLTKYFKKIGLIDQYDVHGAFKRKVCVPECIMRSPREHIREFLKGVFESDGWLRKDTPRVSIFSKHYEFLQDIQLLLLGFGITSKLDSYKTKNGQGYNYTANRIEIKGEQADHFRHKIGFLSKRKIEKFSTWKVKSHIKRTKNILIDKIKSIEYIGEKEVFDITIEDTHQFSANGILVHNCDEAFQASGQRVFSPVYIKAVEQDICKPEFIGDIHGLSRTGEKALQKLRFDKNPNGNLYMWGMPDKTQKVRHRYCFFGDIGGRTDKADWSVLRGIDRYWMIEGDDPEFILTFRGHLDQDLFAWKCAQICMAFAMPEIGEYPLLAIETNSLRKTEAQEGGHFFTVLNEIAPYYPNLYIRNDDEKVGDGWIPKYGFQTNHQTKGKIIDAHNAAARERYQKDFEEQEGYGYIEKDMRAVDEMKFYEVKPDGSLGAIAGKNDDIEICTAGGIWLATKYLPKPFYVKEETGYRKKKVKTESDF